MDPLSITALAIGGGSLLSQLGFSIANAAKPTPKVQGPTGAERLAAASTRQLADKLQTGQGMTDTQYNIRMAGAKDVAAGGAAQTAGALRGTFNMPGVVADRLLRETFSKTQSYLAKTQQELTLADIETALSNLKSSAQAEAVATQAAGQVGQAERYAEEKRLQFKMMKEEALTNSLLGVAKGTAGLLEVVGKLNAMPKTPEDLGKLTGMTVTAEDALAAEKKRIEEATTAQRTSEWETMFGSL